MTMATELTIDPLPASRIAAATPCGEARVTGFTAEIEGRLPRAEMHSLLDALAGRSAFRFVGLEYRGRTAGEAVATVDARFELAAPEGSTGDAQIYALLFELSKVLRWQGLRKNFA